MGMVIGIVSKPKTGKTVSACTFPKPMLLEDYDRGFESVKNTRGKDGLLVVPDWKNITVIEFYKKQQAPLIFKSYASTGDKAKTIGPAPEYTKDAINVIDKYNSLMKELFDKGTITINGAEIGPFKSLVIDPATTMFRVWKDALLLVNNIAELRRGDYLALEGLLANQFIPNLKALSDIIPYIILTDHEDFDATEDGTIINEFPVGPSKNMGKNLSEFLDELWRMEVKGDGTYVWRTKNYGLFKGAGSRLDLSDPISPATFQVLDKILKEREVI